MRATTLRKAAFGLRQRFYSAQAAQTEEHVATLPKQAPKVTKLPNGAIVASVENYSPVTRVAVALNAGPRFESGNNLGITHCLRTLADLTNSKSTTFAITRKIQQVGASLTCTSTRENMVYSIESLRDNVGSGIEFLNHIIVHPEFRPWEVTDAAGRHELDLAMIRDQPEISLTEALHEAAYRKGLGNSLYMQPFQLGSFSAEQLGAYMGNMYTAGRSAFVGVGIDHDDLVNYARHFNLPQGTADTTKSVYSGGEIRVKGANEFVHASIVTEGAGYSSKDLLPLLVLQHAMGTGPHIKYSSNIGGSKVSQAAAKGTSSPYAVSCVNMTYSDSGLFGFHVIGHAAEMASILKSLVAEFASATKGGISEKDVAKAKAQAKSAVAMSMEGGPVQLDDYVEQAMFAGEILEVNTVCAAIDAVKAADVNHVAKKVINGTPTMAAVGDLSNTPYLNELMK